LNGLSVSVSYASGSGWLANPTLSSTTAPATLTVQPSTAALSAGTYTATATVASSVAGVSAQAVTITFTVTAATSPAIGLSPASLTFSAVAGGTAPAAQNVSVTNIGAGTLNGLSASVTYISGSGWLSASLGGATAAPATLAVQPNTASLAAGSYAATISIASSLSGVSAQTVNVTYTVSSTTAPAIGLAPTSLSFSAVAGGATPSAQTVSVTNIGIGTLNGLSANVTYTSGSGWLNASLGGATTAPATLTIQPSTASLPGTYTATVTVASSLSGVSPQTVAVTYTVSPPAPAGATATVISATEIDLSWSSVAGATYNLYWSTAPGVTPANGTRIPVVTPAYHDTGLQSGTTHYYVVTAVVAGVESAASSPAVSGTTAPYISANMFTLASGLGASAYSVAVQDGAGGASISTATVQVNGTTFSYDSGKGVYSGNLALSPGDLVSLNVTLNGVSYTASANQFTTYPTVTAPIESATWAANSANNITWMAGLPGTGAVYWAGVLTSDGTAFVWGNGTGGPNTYPMGTLSATVPANSLVAGSWLVLLGIDVSIPVSNALPGSNMQVMAGNLVQITVQ
jgi:hypothetical protein